MLHLANTTSCPARPQGDRRTHQGQLSVLVGQDATGAIVDGLGPTGQALGQAGEVVAIASLAKVQGPSSARHQQAGRVPPDAQHRQITGCLVGRPDRTLVDGTGAAGHEQTEHFTVALGLRPQAVMAQELGVVEDHAVVNQHAAAGRMGMVVAVEATLVEGLLPQSMRRTDSRTDSYTDHQWFWDGMEHVDPAKEANAQATRLASHTTTLAYEFARQGRDWEAELRQRAKEVALMNQLGLPLSQASPSTPATPIEPTDPDTTDQENDDEPTAQNQRPRNSPRNAAA